MNYWQTHMHAFETAGISERSFDSDWLDIGTWFGVMPWAQRQLGFLNIDTQTVLCIEWHLTNSSKSYGPAGYRSQELHIEPKQTIFIG